MDAQHQMRVMDMSGDYKVIWDPDVDEEVKKARETFNDRKKMGYIAYSVKRDGEKGKVIHEFDPDAAKIILAPPISGG